jgi:outer membrane protein TolC
MLNRWLVPISILFVFPSLAQDQPAPEFASPKVAPATLQEASPAETVNAVEQLPGPEPETVSKHARIPADTTPAPTGKDFFGPGTDLYTLSLDEAIQSALVNNLDSRVERAGLSIEQARVRNAYGEFDPVFSFSVSRSWVQTPDNRQNLSSADAVAQLQGIEAQINAINANTRANQEFTNAILQALGRPTQQFNTVPLTADLTGNDRIIFDQDTDCGEVSIQARTPIGTILRASARLTKIRSTFEGDTREIEPTYLANTLLEFRQPLLKDFGFAANLADLRIARKNREAQEFTWRFTLERTLQEVVANYYDMLFGLADLKNKGDAITEGIKLVAHSQRRQELGFFSPYEVKQAQVQLSFDRENLLLAKNIFLERQFGMKRLILPGFQTSDNRILLPKEIPELKIPPLNSDQLLAIAFQNRLDYKAAILAAEAEDVRLKFARNQMWPQLDVVGSYGWSGLDSSYPSAVGQMMEGQAPQWQLGITGGFPLGGIQPRAQLDAAKARKEQAILRVQTAELNVGLAVKNGIELIRTNQQRLKTARLTTSVATEAVHIGFRRMEEGLISNFDLIEQQRRLYDARTRELNAVAELNKSITQLWLATGTVLENLNISWVPVGKPVKKATVVTETKVVHKPRQAPRAKAKR